MKNPLSRGSVVLLVLVFGGIFFGLLMALSGFVLSENRAQDVTRARTEGLSIAEAGLDYYRWFLTHFPGNTQNGTGHDGPYVITYADPESGTAGTYTLSITSNTSCGVVQSMDVTSKGVPDDAPNISTTLVARFSLPSVATYSYIVGSSVWAGADRIINGPYHSNGGIRMDGTANAPVTSSLSSWNCTSSFGCSPAQPTAPGVLGIGGNQTLWNYPTPQIDFAGIAANFSALKTTASASGIYLARISTSGGHNPNPNIGYHLIFNGDSTVTVKKVTAVTALSVNPVNSTSGSTDYALIRTESTFQTLPLPSQCGVIFVEDNTWIEGTIPKKITVVAANVTSVGITPDVFLKNNIVYSTYDGSVGLTVISASDVLITPDSPMNMTLNGIFIAQGGAFGRNLYDCPSAYEPRGTLTILGTTVSNLRTGTRWSYGCNNSSDAGYQTRIDAYDRQNAGNPPPFTPSLSTQWEFINWRQL